MTDNTQDPVAGAPLVGATGEGAETTQHEEGQVQDALPDRTCPTCEFVSPGDSKTCCICGFNFETGEKALAEEPSARKATIPFVIGADGHNAYDDGSQPPVPHESSHTLIESPEPARVEPTLRRALQPSPDSVVYGVAMPTVPKPATAATTASDSNTGAARTSFEQATASPTAPSTVAATGASTVQALPPSGFGIEPSAVSIPELHVTHPSTPHVVLIVDREFRRGRPPTELSPVGSDPQVLPLTMEAHAFGRSIKSFCLDFDRAASGLHGFFQIRDDGGYAIRDESKNGTKLNGVYIEKGMATPLKNGDVITLGVWTKIIYWDGTQANTQATTTSE